MKVLGTASLVLAASLAALPTGAAAMAHHRALCVAHHRGCYRTVQAAVAAAHQGDTVRIGRGTFRGGVRVLTSLHLVGSGAGSTIIRGGGPVLTIGRFGATREPAVSIAGVTVTGGRTRSSAQSRRLLGRPGALALGGGIEVPPGVKFSTGATVTITDSVITGNHVAPRVTVRSGLPCGRACPFALAGGGGIDNWGMMTLTNVVVSDNTAGGALNSDADAGGIYSPQGHLTLRRSVAIRNRAVARRPYGRFAEGGGIDITSTPFFLAPRRRTSRLTIDDSRITANAAVLADDFPSGVEAHATTGGVLVAGDDDCTGPTSGCVRAAIRNSSISGNTVTASNAAGDATGFGGGLGVDGILTLRESAIRGNRVLVTVPASSTAGAFGDSGGVGMGGYASISDSRLLGNSVTVRAPGGTASAMFGGLSSGNPHRTTTISHSAVNGNRLSATTATGSITLQGAGIGHLNGAPLVLRRTTIKRNVGTGTGPAGLAQGGGIWNGDLDPSSPVGPLDVSDSTITLNALRVAGVTGEGGGIFTVARPNLRGSTISHNTPDQCHGC